VHYFASAQTLTPRSFGIRRPHPGSRNQGLRNHRPFSPPLCLLLVLDSVLPSPRAGQRQYIRGVTSRIADTQDRSAHTLLRGCQFRCYRTSFDRQVFTKSNRICPPPRYFRVPGRKGCLSLVKRDPWRTTGVCETRKHQGTSETSDWSGSRPAGPLV
jgi:hypothetical protein